MSEPEKPDPIDKAYVQAEAMLDDAAARAARRARVLGAVAAEAQAPQAAPRRRGWGLPGGPGGWLAAASVAGLAVLFAVRANQVRIAEPLPVPAQVAAPAPAAPEPAPESVAESAREAAPGTAPTPSLAPPQAAAPPLPAAQPAPAARVQSRAEAFPESEAPMAALAPPPPPPPPPPSAGVAQPRAAAPALAAPQAAPRAAVTDSAPSEVVVTASRVDPRSAAKGGAASPAVLGQRLRAAAAAGRVAELKTLLDQGAFVDAQDEAGETALMQAIRRNRPAAAALLRERGADIDLANLSGDSARDLVAANPDPALRRALGLTP